MGIVRIAFGVGVGPAAVVVLGIESEFQPPEKGPPETRVGRRRVDLRKMDELGVSGSVVEGRIVSLLVREGLLPLLLAELALAVVLL